MVWMDCRWCCVMECRAVGCRVTCAAIVVRC